MSDLPVKISLPKFISEETVEEAFEIISKVKMMLVLKQPFYGVLMSMTDFISDSHIRTMATDGKSIYYNPAFVTSLNEKEIYGVMIHEISHCIYLHMKPERRLNTERKKWNIATDFAINIEISDMAVESTDIELPKINLCLDPKYRDMNAEQIYDMLSPEDTIRYSTMDVHLEPMGDNNWDDMEDKIIAAYEGTREFYEGSTRKGRLPSGIHRLIKSLKKAKVPWERFFQRYIGEALARDDFSYSRLNRKHVAQDIFLPSLRNYVLGRLVLVADTSGSVTDEMIKCFCAEMIKISHLVDEIIIMTCDAKVHEVIRLHKMQNFLDKLDFKGKGGTNFIPAFDKVKEMNIVPDLLIYLTDTYGTFPDKPPPYPVIWCITEEKGKVPWGASVFLPHGNKKGAY